MADGPSYRLVLHDAEVPGLVHRGSQAVVDATRRQVLKNQEDRRRLAALREADKYFFGQISA